MNILDYFRSLAATKTPSAPAAPFQQVNTLSAEGLPNNGAGVLTTASKPYSNLPADAAWLNGPVALTGWGNDTGPVSVHSLTSADTLFIGKWLRVGAGSASDAVNRLLSGSPTEVRNVLANVDQAGVTRFNPTTYNGPLRKYFEQWLSVNPRPQYPFGPWMAVFDPIAMDYKYQLQK